MTSGVVLIILLTSALTGLLISPLAISKQLKSALATLGIFIAFICSILLAIKEWNQPSYQTFEWFNSGNFNLLIGYYFTHESQIMLVIVTGVSFLVHFYSISYMKEDPGVDRYFGGLALFTTAMVILVVASGLLAVFMAWELVGFSSWLLIGHYQDRITASRAAAKAFIMNRVGDAAMLAGILLLLVNAGTDEIPELTKLAIPQIGLATFLIFLGVVGKSAQFPLFTWLPDAMEGPTPVSALLHAATMVAAGIYILIRIYIIIPVNILYIISIIGFISAFIGSVSALNSFSLKRILAYSTMSQLGIMLISIGVGIPGVAFLHLISHALFKAGLFLVAGIIIHQTHTGDIREMNGLRKSLPLIFTLVLVFAAAMAGLPGTTGYIHKEVLITHLVNQKLYFQAGLVLLLSMLTVLYLMRLIWYIFFKHPVLTDQPTMKLTGYFIPLIPLGILSVGTWLSLNPFETTTWIYPDVTPHNWLITALVLGLIAGSVLLGIYFEKQSKSILPLPEDAPAKWTDLLIETGITKPVLLLSEGVMIFDRKINSGLHLIAYLQVSIAYLTSWFDKWIVDGFVRMLAWISRLAGNTVRSVHSGEFQLYLFWAVLVIVLFITWFVL